MRTLPSQAVDVVEVQSHKSTINVDIQMCTNIPHKAVPEAHVAAEVIAGELQGNQELAAAAFNARVIPSVAYTDPEVAWSVPTRAT